MGRIGAFEPEKLLIGVLIASPGLREDVIRLLEEEFGPVDYSSGLIPFAWTDYYAPEMGSAVSRLFLSFRDLTDPSRLPEIKIRTNDLEESRITPSGRNVNLDPGLLSMSRLILATTKDNAHRIPLRGGIYGEITLLYRRGEFRPLEWTYPDYRSPEYHRILLEIRELLARQLRERRSGASGSGD